jgi:hydroxymethylpyrimidine/phosphomethylpyrimidine kinase
MDAEKKTAATAAWGSDCAAGTGTEGGKRRYRRVLSIAGSDCSGGAGVQADIKTISACGCYAMSAITALVAENTVGVQAIHSAPVDFVLQEIRSCLDDIGADAIKIGMLDSPELIRGVAELLQARYPEIPVVLDPVMVAQSGDRLIPDDAAEALKTGLVSIACVITPNLPEAEVLLGRPIRTVAELEGAARELCERLGCRNALVKGGHLEGAVSDDTLHLGAEGRCVAFPTARIATKNNHGTGCTLSSAIASFLAKGLPVEDAVREAKHYITEAIRTGAAYEIGHGHGPVCHFWATWGAGRPDA